MLAFDQNVAQAAVDINNMLKRMRKQTGIADLFIAATAISNNLPLTTLNTFAPVRVPTNNFFEDDTYIANKLNLKTI